MESKKRRFKRGAESRSLRCASQEDNLSFEVYAPKDLVEIKAFGAAEREHRRRGERHARLHGSSLAVFIYRDLFVHIMSA